MNLQKKLLGIKDSRSNQGIFSRGANVYNAGTSSAHSGGGYQFGRPAKRRLTSASQKNKLQSRVKPVPRPEAIKRRMVKR